MLHVSSPLDARLAPLRQASFGSLGQLSPTTLSALLDLAISIKSAPGSFEHCLRGLIYGLIFEKHSTRTRVSFEVGIRRLGGDAIFLSRNEIQLGRGEPVADTARVLGRYLDGIVLRTFGHDRFEEMAGNAGVPVINALTDSFHPCQVLADLLTMREHFSDLAGRRVAWVGDGNNMAHSMLLGTALAGMDLRIASPPGHACDPAVVSAARAIATGTAGSAFLCQEPAEAVHGAQVVITDVFTSMGQEAEQAARMKAFEGFQVNDALMAKAAPGAIFLHCLPAHRGEEVTAAVIDGPRSLVWDEAENRLYAQMALLVAIHQDPCTIPGQ